MAGEGRYLLGSTDNVLRDRSTGTINKAAEDGIELGPRTIQHDQSVEGTSYQRIKTTVGCCACTETNRDKIWFQIILFSFVLLFDVADMFSDWSLFCDVIKIKSGLVFGPPETGIIYALLCFSVLGTITFSVEIVNVWLEIFYHQPLIDPELVCMCTVWIEDVPQIIINIFIALCREYAISYYQVVKAVVIILGSLTRVLMALVRFVDRQNDDETEDKPSKTGFRHLFYRVFIMLGLFLLFFSSIAICFLTLFEHTPDGYIKFGTPKGLYHGKYERPSDCEKFLRSETTNSVIIQFSLIPEKIPELAFGDIHYNIQFQDQAGCHNVIPQPVSDISHRIEGGDYHPVIHYYKTYNISQTNHLVWESETNPRFYHQKTDLTDIISVWKTGFAFCESTGSLAPHEDSSIDVNCI
ncbi:unnamed protein product [Mytilus edulis]|uniref:Uncharacterized protein n=1 Tax=Mytilus edulis TaxID=6550 RepID=A0A8S3U3A5_MYTED|nr:unnamed protein product [Mytilus edulis]